MGRVWYMGKVGCMGRVSGRLRFTLLVRIRVRSQAGFP